MNVSDNDLQNYKQYQLELLGCSKDLAVAHNKIGELFNANAELREAILERDARINQLELDLNACRRGAAKGQNA